MKLTPFILKTSTFLISSYLMFSIASASYLIEEGENVRNRITNIVKKHNPVSPQEDQSQKGEGSHKRSSAQESRPIKRDQGLTGQKHQSGPSKASHFVEKVGDQDSTQLSLSDLVTRMSQAPSTWLGGWDVMSSYAEGPLNLELAAQQTKNPNILSQSNTFTNTINFGGNKFTTTTTVQFGNPTFAFGDPLVQLVMPIASGTYSLTDSDGKPFGTTTTFPANTYSILCQAPIKGVVGNSTFTSNEAIDFTSASTTAQFFIHVMGKDNTNITFTSSAPANAPDSASDYYSGYEAILAWLSNNSNVHEVDYPILSATSVASTNNSLTLTPKSCAFNVNSGFLSVYIQTNESGNPTPTSVPNFQPNNLVTAPVPNDVDSSGKPLYNSSIIFSQALMENYYLNKAIIGLSTGIKSGNLIRSNPESINGIVANLYADQPVKTWDLGYDHQHFDGSYETFSLSFSLDFSEPSDVSASNIGFPFTLNLLNSSATIAWNYTQTSPWNYAASGHGGNSGAAGSGNVTISTSLNAQIGTLTNEECSFTTLILPSSYTSAQPIITTETSGFDFATAHVSADYIKTQIDNYFNSTAASMPSISISLKPLYYVAEANILFNKQAFQANTAAGINVPGDLIIVGNINPSS